MKKKEPKILKSRILEFELGSGRCYYRLQYKPTWSPFWINERNYSLKEKFDLFWLHRLPDWLFSPLIPCPWSKKTTYERKVQAEVHLQTMEYYYKRKSDRKIVSVKVVEPTKPADE